MMKIKIRNAAKNDVNSIYRLGHSIKEFTVSNRIKFYEKAEMLEWVRKKDDIFLVAEHERKIVGFAFCKILSSKWAMLDSLGVSEKYRYGGIGTMLLDRTMIELHKKHVTFVQAFVGSDHIKSRKFWKKHGFKEGRKFIWIDKILHKRSAI